MIEINRKRYIPGLQTDDKDFTLILCGSSGNRSFRMINDIGSLSVDTYRTEKEAMNVLKTQFSSDMDITNFEPKLNMIVFEVQEFITDEFEYEPVIKPVPRGKDRRKPSSEV